MDGRRTNGNEDDSATRAVCTNRENRCSAKEALIHRQDTMFPEMLRSPVDHPSPRQELRSILRVTWLVSNMAIDLFCLHDFLISCIILS